MAFTTHRIVVSFKDHIYTVHYWADGRGQRADGYATSLAQLRHKIHHHYGVRSLNLFYISGGKYRLIADDERLRRVLSHVANGEKLHVSASESSHTSSAHSDHSQSSGSTKDSVKTALKQYAVHNTECYHCKCDRIHGVRYIFIQNPKYSVCGKCYDKLETVDAKRKWRSRALPWTRDAPVASLHRNENGNGVRHLQYLLTRLGYLNSGDDSGKFGSRTEAAVEKFRRKNHVSGNNVREYDYRTEVKLAEVVQRLRSEGHKYL